MKKIAIIVFVPNQKHLIDQFFALYYSVMLHPGLRNECDFIIGCSEDITEFFNLENCVVVHTNEISKDSEFKFINRENEYGYVNSWSHFLDQSSIDVILEYPYALRIDVDTFLSPSILDVGLEQDEILVGQGGYIGGQETKDNILRIADDLNLNHRGQHNLGSTWLTHSHIMVGVGQAAIECVRHIMKHEFLDNEGEWPRWFAGVTLLYAGELALNHSPYTITQTQKLDYGTTNKSKIKDALTLHAWHTDEFYSKHWFMSGRYDDKELCYDLDRCDNFAFWCSHSGRLLADTLRKSTEDHLSIARNISDPAPVHTFTPVQAIRFAGALLAQALPKTPIYILRRLKQKLQNRR